VQPALLFAAASAALSSFFLLLFGAGLTAAHPTFFGFFLLFLDATCAGLGATSTGLAGFLFLIVSATCAGLAASSTVAPRKGEARPRKQSGHTNASKGFLDFSEIHGSPP
jgi:hypothetical protein